MPEKLKIVALEEHYITPAIRDANLALPPEIRDPSANASQEELDEKLLDLGEARLARMDDAGVDVAVLSVTTPATQSLPAAQAIPLAREANDALAEAIRRFPDRLLGFATLPTPDPQAAADELRRCVGEFGFKGAMLNGRTGDRYLDAPEFLPVFQAAVDLGVPVYVHPQGPPAAVRTAHFDGFDPALSGYFATGGYGWHVETAINALRMILSGLFEKLPELQVVLGHWGETVTFYLERADTMSRFLKTERGVAQTFRENFFVTPAGLDSQPMFLHAVETVGADRILFSTDDPFRPAPHGAARAFLEGALVSPADKKKIAWDNAARLLRL